MRALFALVLAIAAVPAEAQAPPPPADTRLRTVIVGITARRGVEDPKLADALADVVQGVYTKDLKRVVIGREDIRRVLELEADKATLGCDSDKCLAEISTALDAQRIVNGALDKLGDGYLVTLSEIDAKTLEPVSRVSERVPADENKLVDAVERLAAQMLQQAPTASAVSVIANAGSIDIETDPRGASITLGGTEMGKTPTKIDNLATGNQKLRLIRDDYEPIEVEVPVYPGGVTKVKGEMRILRSLAEQNLEVRRAHWRDDDTWHTVIGWSKIGGGTVVGGAGSLVLLAGVLNGGVNGASIVGAVITTIGVGFFAWGVIDLLNPIPPPVPEWEVERRVRITPPSGKGEERTVILQQKVLQPGKAPTEQPAAP